MPKNVRTRAHASNGVRNWATKRAGVGGLMVRLVVVAIVLMVGSGCLGAYEERARAEAERAEADRIAAEAEANRSQIEAQAEAEAARIQAQADADAERVRAEAERAQAQAEADRAASEIQRALGDRAISEAVADQVTANSEYIRAQASVTHAQANQYNANAWALYALAGAGLLLMVGGAVFMILAGMANLIRARTLSEQYPPVRELPQADPDGFLARWGYALEHKALTLGARETNNG
jgi:hypothetical protein